MYHRLVTSLTCACLLVPAVLAQSTGRITGSVTDSTGAPVPAAAVTLNMSGSSAVVARTATSTEGIYSFAAVQAGSYDLIGGNYRALPSSPTAGWW